MELKNDVDYLIVGGGLAGGYAILGARKRDTSGRLLLVNEEPHLPYDRVPLSKNYLMDKVERQKVFLKTKEFYDSQKAELITGHRVQDLDTKSRTVDLDDGRMLSFKRLLLATGGKPRKLPLAGSDLQGVYYLRTIDDCEHIKGMIDRSRKAVVIGGGFIGCELAAAFATRGLETTIIEVGPYLLNMAIDQETGHWIGNYFSKKGVQVMTQATASRFVGENDRVVGVEMKDGQTIQADFVVVGVGISPSTELAEKAGLKVDRGVVVNEHLETEVEGIYAAGDVARFYNPIFKRHLRVEHYDVAVKHGKIAGANMTGDNQSFDELPYFFSYQFDLNINAYGDLTNRTQIIRRGSPSVEKGFYQFYLEDHQLSAVLSVNRRWPEVKIAKSLVLFRKMFSDPSILADESKDLQSLT